MLRFHCKRIVLLGAALLLTGCTALPNPAGQAEIGGLVIDNLAGEALIEVQLFVVKSRSFVSCGYIPPGTQCSTTFPLRHYQGNDIEVRWTQAGLRQGTRPFVVPLPDPVPQGQALQVVITIGGASGFNAFMRPI